MLVFKKNTHNLWLLSGLILLALVLVQPKFSLAATSTTNKNSTSTNTSNVNTNQPGCTGQSATDVTTKVCTDFGAFSNIGDYLSAIISTWVIPLGVTAAILMITFAGFQYIYSGGSPETIKLAKELIVGAILGLIIIFMASYILNAIVPSDELNVNLGRINQVQKIG